MYKKHLCILSMPVTSAMCTVLYPLTMWTACRFRDTPPHFARGPGDAAKCFSLAESSGMGASATVSCAAWEPGGSTP